MNTILAFGLGGWEVFLILAAVLLLFGSKKLPELARGMGQGIKEFKKATRDVTDEIHGAMDETPVPPPQKRISAPTVTTEPAQTISQNPASQNTTEPAQTVSQNPPGQKV
jgi:sec-independent protein translocase protein TatA